MERKSQREFEPIVRTNAAGPRSSRARCRGRLAGVIVWVAAICAWPPLAPPAGAVEQAWVRSEIRLNVRSGAGVQFRILGVIGTGDEVAILKREEDWTKIRIPDGKEGWIPVGYLKPDAPPTIRLGQLETEVARLREELAKSTSEAGELRSSSESLSAKDEEQRGEIERLSFENMKLRAGARWPEMIAGASILAAGMIIGAMLHRSSSRKPSSRIRF